MDDPRSIAVAVGFGILFGWGLGLREESRTAGVAAFVVCLLVGVALWRARPDPAVALVAGAAVGLPVLLARRIRPRSGR